MPALEMYLDTSHEAFYVEVSANTLCSTPAAVPLFVIVSPVCPPSSPAFRVRNCVCVCVHVCLSACICTWRRKQRLCGFRSIRLSRMCETQKCVSAWLTVVKCASFLKHLCKRCYQVDAALVRACVHACVCMHSKLSTLGVEPAHFWIFSHLFAQGDSSQWRLRIACEDAELQPCKAWELGCACICVFMQACIPTCMFTNHA